MPQQQPLKRLSSREAKQALEKLDNIVEELITAVHIGAETSEDLLRDNIKLQNVIRELQEKIGINYHTSAEIARLKQELEQQRNLNRKLQEALRKGTTK